MSKEFKEKIRNLYGDMIETTIREWLAPDMLDIDRSLTEVYLSEPNPSVTFNLLLARKKKILDRIHELTTGVVLLFAETVETLESSGYSILMDTFFEDQIKAYLQRMGVRAGYLEGACLDIT